MLIAAVRKAYQALLGVVVFYRKHLVATYV